MLVDLNHRIGKEMAGALEEHRALKRWKEAQQAPPPQERRWKRWLKLAARWALELLEPLELVREVGPGLPPERRHEWEKRPQPRPWL